MANMESRNRSMVTEFILLGFSNEPGTQVLIFLIFLVYLTLLVANTLLILAVIVDHHLHNPMYIFLINLSIMNITAPSATVPKMLVNFVIGENIILFSACMAQMFFSSLVGGCEFILLLFMAYDRYVAVCIPLRYSRIMNVSAYTWMNTVAWTVSSVMSSVYVSILSNMTFCGSNIVHNFFCVFTSLMVLSCSDTSVLDTLSLYSSAIFVLIPLLLILFSYYKIIASIMRIHSGRYKAFSSCTSHLIVVTLFYGMALITFMRPKVSVDNKISKALSVFYVVIIPVLNPLIYSLRNRDVHGAWRRLHKMCLNLC